MTYTTPNLKAAGENLTAADWNTSVVANLEALAKRPCCAAERTTSQSLTAGQAIAFNATDRVDTHSMHDPSTNNTRITVPADWGGVYLITATTQASDIRLRANGTTTHARGSWTVSALIALAPGDYIETIAGADITIDGAHMSAIWMRVPA